MTDHTKDETWAILINQIGSCLECVHNPVCKQIKAHIKHCVKEKYRYRCPIEVLDERTEE